MLGLGALNAVAAELSAAEQSDLMRLLRHDCGACHGMWLTGGLGPPLTERALARKPPDALRAVIWDGRPAAGMPPWQGILSQQQVHWLVDRLQEGIDESD